MAAKEKEAMFNLKNHLKIFAECQAEVKTHYMAFFFLFPGSNFSCLAFPEIHSSGEKCTHLTWSLPEQKKTQV